MDQRVSYRVFAFSTLWTSPVGDSGPIPIFRDSEGFFAFRACAREAIFDMRPQDS
jgi:hypothetical protein